ncbi:hypothetical protein [Methylobacterium sp. GC_Met_2]|uniref:hypothetical protein n=1 Tax=Methylobacterium sp. GC_Met_2 TaxID=2937376 RepID=UPI00226B4F0E|nr:hypothetical protein [Methylobacterium sp. GC_Met_2]
MKSRRPIKAAPTSIVSERRRDARQWAKERASSSLPGIGELHRRGGVEGAIELLRRRIALDDHRQRAAIDQQVKWCHLLARHLAEHPTSDQTSFNGEWAKFWLRTKNNPTAALRFVCTRAYVDNKKGSYYYRATRMMFEEGLSIEDLPARVTAAGGYDKLVKQNVRSHRQKTPDGAAVRNDSSKLSVEQDGPNASPGFRSNGPRSAQHAAPATNQQGKVAEDQITLRAVLGPKGASFERLQDGCRAHVEVEILGFDGRDWHIRIIAAASLEP